MKTKKNKMKSVFNLIDRKIKIVAETQLLYPFTGNSTTLFCLIVLLGTFLFTGCKKYDVSAPKSETQSISNKEINADKELLTYYNGLDPRALRELQQARSATARYLDIRNAFKDGYEDIGLVMPNMGYHFMKFKLVDSVFDVRKPELLVYNKDEDGSFELGAVEYAVPIDPQSPNTPPEGFTGKADVWDFNTNNSGLWTLHAWVWKNNPDGVFNMTNPLVQVR